MSHMTEAKRVVEILAAQGATIAFAESCTGGLLTKLITDVPGASAVLRGGVCAYANEVKHGVLGVPQRELDTYGAVSRLWRSIWRAACVRLWGRISASVQPASPALRRTAQRNPSDSSTSPWRCRRTVCGARAAPLGKPRRNPRGNRASGAGACAGLRGASLKSSVILPGKGTQQRFCWTVLCAKCTFSL